MEETGARKGVSTPGGSAPVTVAELLRDDLARALNVLTPVELDPDNGDAHCRCRTDAADAGGAVQRGFDRQRNERLHLGGHHPGTFDKNGDSRRAQIREHIHRHLGDRVSTPDQERGRKPEHDGAIVKRPANQRINHVRFASSAHVRAPESGSTSPQSRIRYAPLVTTRSPGCTPDAPERILLAGSPT